jgi:FdhE protein
MPAIWDAGACPICGAWLALAEMRGLEKTRRLRCGRCGGDWGYLPYRCAYCGTHDQRRIGSLVPEAEAESRRVETCDACHGYLKSLATLLPWPAEEVPLADLASVELDLAARDRGYDRPAAPAFALDCRITTDSSR